MIDFKSTLVAAIIGAAVSVLIDHTLADSKLTTSQAAMYGGLIGAVVQMGVRLTGVS